MEKTIIVTDQTGKPIGTTYPKRAAGLVKCGRAVYLDSKTIRMTEVRTQAGSQQAFEKMEAASMAQKIEFSARDYCAESNHADCTAERRMITILGQDVEEFAFGDGEPEQIISKKVFEPNTDILLRFAVIGGVSDTEQEICRCAITPEGNEEERIIYELSQSRYRPALSKEWNGELLRVYELPYHVGEEERVTVALLTGHCETGFLPAFSAEEYEPLPDLDYAAWRQKREKFLEEKRKEQEKQQMFHILEEGNFRPNPGSGGLFLNNSFVSPEILRELMEKAEKGAVIILSDVNQTEN